MLINPGYVGYLTQNHHGIDHSTFDLVSRMTTAPSAARLVLINTCITSLKTLGLWDKIKVLWITKAHTAQAGYLNWKNESAYDLVKVGTVTETVDSGFTGDGLTGYYTTGYTPPASCQNSNFIFSWAATDVSALQNDIGMNSFLINPRNAGNFTTRNSSTTGNTIATANSIGMSLSTRDNSANYRRYKDAVDLTNATQTSATPAALQLYYGARNASGTADQFSTRRLIAGGFGETSLTAQNVTDFYTTLNTYLTAF